MYQIWKRLVGALLASSILSGAYSELPPPGLVQANNKTTLDAFAEQVLALTKQDNTEEYYHELRFEKATGTLYRDDIPAGDAHGEIYVENHTLMLDTKEPLPRSLRGSTDKSFKHQAERNGYTYEETEDDILITNDFQTARLIVKAYDEIDTYGAKSVVSGYRNLHILQYEDSAQAYAAYKRFEADPDIEFVQPSRIVQLGEPRISAADSEAEAAPAPKTHYTWGAPYMGVDSFIEQYLSTELLPEVVVAVVDTGINRSQALLQGRILDDEVNYSNSGNDTAVDDYGHGTHCAGTIVELTPDNVKILPIKVFDKTGNGTDEQIYLGLMYAIEHGADLLSMSFGGLGVSPLEIEAMSIADANGLACIAAAGNNSDDAAYFYPGGIDTCITVAAVDQDFRLADFSNYGEMIDVAAPGVEILSTVLGEQNEMEEWDGTSMATPHVTACCALLKSYDPSLSPAKIQALIQANARDIGQKGFDEEFGWGFISMEPFDWYEGVCHAPTFSFPSGHYGNTIHVEVECPTTEAAVYYTTDGTVPSAQNGTLYTEPITITASTWLRAVAVHEGYESSYLSEAAYTIDSQDVAEPFLFENGVITAYRGISANPVIPSVTPDGKAVTAIGAGAFADNSYLVTLKLPTTVTTIHDDAFRNCQKLRTVSGVAVTSIGSHAFSGCTALELITLPDGFSAVGEAAFSDCTALEEIDLGKATVVPDSCFLRCEELALVNMPKVTKIGAEAFAGCTLLSELHCTWDAVTEIGSRAFRDCTAFSGELSLTALEALGEAAFSGMTSLRSVLLSDAIPALPKEVLRGCTGLRYLSAPAVTSIGDSALALKKASTYNLITDLPFHQITEIGKEAFEGCPLGDSISTVSFDALTTIPYRGFYKAYSAALSFPNVTSIEAYAFYSASVNVLSLPAVTALPDFTVMGCKYVVLPEGELSLSENAIAESVQVIAAAGKELPGVAIEKLHTAPVWIQKTATSRTAAQFSYPECGVLAAGIGLTYQWYRKEADGALTALDGQTNQIFVPGTKTVGKTEYVCKAADRFGQVISTNFTLTVTAQSIESIFEHTPLYLETTALTSYDFQAKATSSHVFSACGDSRLIGVVTDADNRFVCDLSSRTQQVEIPCQAGQTYRIHLKQIWNGVTQLSLSDGPLETAALSDCRIAYKKDYHKLPDAELVPELTITAPDGKALIKDVDYQIYINPSQAIHAVTVFGIGRYRGCISLPIEVYTVVEAETPTLVSLSSAKDTQTFVFTPKESGKYHYYATYTARYKTEYETFLRTGSVGTHKSYDTKVSCKVYDSNKTLISSNSFHSYTGNRFSASVDLLAGQTYTLVCAARSAAEYNLMISPTFHTLRSIKAVGNFSAIYDDTEPYTPKVRVLLDGETLVENQDYVLVHSSNDVPGLAGITIVGIGKYAGVHTQEYKISYDGLHLSENVIALDETININLSDNRIQTYWFTADSGVEGKKKTSYTIESTQPKFIRCGIFKPNTVSGAYTLVTVADGQNAFELENGTYCLVFYSAFPDTKFQTSVTLHRPYNLNTAEIVAKDAIYTGDPLTPELTVTVDGQVLEQDVDYQIRFLDEHALFGTREFLIIPKNTYTAYDSCLSSFEIVVSLPKEPPILTIGTHEADVTLTDRLAVYRICPEEDMRCLIVSTDVMDTVIRIFDDETTLLNEVYGTGTQCLTFDAKAGETYYLMIKFNGFNREGKLHFEFKNEFRLLEECETEIQPVVWTGEETTPDIRFLDERFAVVEGVDYQLRYTYDDVNIGTASANFIGLGDYYGSCEVNYDIIAPDLFALEDFTAFPMLHQKKYSGEEETECDYLIYKYSSGLDTKLSLRIHDLFCRMTLQFYDENGVFLESAEFTSNGEIPFELSANETVYILMSATDINSSNQTFMMYIADVSSHSFRTVTDAENGVGYRICEALSYAEVSSLDPEAEKAVLMPEISGCPVTFVPEAVFRDLPVPYTVYGYEGCDAGRYSAQYGFAYIPAGQDSAAPHLSGDFNCDGVVSLADVVLLHYLIQEAPEFPAQTVNWEGADANADGLVNAFDLHAFLNRLVQGSE